MPQQNKLNIPLKCNDSDIKYEVYPNNNTNDVSLTGWLFKDVQHLNINNDIAPIITPIISEADNKYPKSINILNDIVIDIF